MSIKYWVNGAKTKVPAADRFQSLQKLTKLTLTDSRATNGDACGKAPPPVKVVGNDDDGGNVTETESASSDDPKEEIEKVDVVGEGRCEEPNGCHH